MGKSWLRLALIAALLSVGGVGCGSDKDKGINSGKDVPRPPQAAQK
jgi:hypothetical protein